MKKKVFSDIDYEMFVMPFGKHEGATLEEIPASYVLWIMNEDCCPDVLKAWAELHEEELVDAKECSELEDVVWELLDYEDTY